MEIVRGMYDAWERGDSDSALSYFHPDVEWSEPRQSRCANVAWAGRCGGSADRVEAFENYRYELHELTGCGKDKVLLAAWQSGRGKLSGAEVAEENFCVFTLGDGKIVKQRMFRRRADPLEAVGLSE